MPRWNWTHAGCRQETAQGSPRSGDVVPGADGLPRIVMLHWERSCVRTSVQVRLLAQQKSTGKDLAKQVAKAKAQHEEIEAQVAAAALDSSIHKLRGAFVVFNEAWLADEAVASAPQGVVSPPHATRSLMPLHRPCPGAAISY